MSRFTTIGLILFLAGLLCLQSAEAQPSGYPYYGEKQQPDQSVVAERLAENLVIPTHLKRAQQNLFKEKREELATELSGELNEFSLSDPIVYPYVQRVFGHILERNPQYDDALLYLLQYPTPNARANADGSIFLHVGLMAKLTTEDQLAYILCHELAHIALQHAQQGMEAQLIQFASPAYQKKIKKLSKQKYNAYAKLQSFMLQESMKHFYRKRQFEQQADSMAYVLYSNTQYDPSEAVKALASLDEVDVPFSLDRINFSKNFGCARLAQQSGGSESIFGEVQEDTFQLTDTLKTHPNCHARAAYLAELGAPTMSKNKAKPISTTIREQSRIELIHAWYMLNRPDHALFEATQFINDGRDLPFLKAVAALSVYKLHGYMKLHRYHEVIKVPDEQRYAPNYNHYLRTLSNIRLSELAILLNCLQLKGSNNHPYTQAARYAFHTTLQQEAPAFQGADEVGKQLYEALIRID